MKHFSSDIGKPIWACFTKFALFILKFQNEKQAIQYWNLHSGIRLINQFFGVGQLDIVSYTGYDHISNFQFEFLEVLHTQKYCQRCNNLQRKLLNHQSHDQYYHHLFYNDMFLLLLTSSLSSLQCLKMKFQLGKGYEQSYVFTLT